MSHTAVRSRTRVLVGILLAMAVVGAACTPQPGSHVGKAPSSACDTSTVAEPGQKTITTTSGGDERWYIRDVPPAHDGLDPLPVVFDYHGYSEGATVHAGHSALGTYGAEQGFVTVTPHGLGEIPQWDTNFGSADLAFAGELFDEIGETLCVDENRLYVTGYSNGGFLTSAIACEYADRIAAAAPVAGIAAKPGCDPAVPVPVVAFHGTADTFVPYDGPPPVPDVTLAWADRNGCDIQPDPAVNHTETVIADDVTLIEYDCPTAPVQLYRVTDGGHSWPGSEFSIAIEVVVGYTTTSISANEVMWKFFAANPRGVG